MSGADLGMLAFVPISLGWECLQYLDWVSDGT